MAKPDLPKRIISEVYSQAADTLYEPIVVRGSFRLFARDLEKLVEEQGRRAIEAAGTGPILDMPIGTGHFTTLFARQHKGLIVGADIAHGMVVATKSRAERDGLDNIVAVRADVHALPFPEGTFSAIMCSNGLQVIPNLHLTLAELHRVLAPRGLLYVSIVNLPLGKLLPDAAEEHLPTMFKSREAMLDAIKNAGFYIAEAFPSRFATLVEARKI